MSSIVIHSAVEENLSQILDLVLEINGDLEEIYAEQFILAYNDESLLVGCGRLINYFYFNEIASIGVRKEYRKHNIGKQIVEALMNNSYDGEGNLMPIYLLCSDENIPFFEKCGFKLKVKCPKELWPKLEKYPDSSNVMSVWK